MRALGILLIAGGSLWAQLPASPSGFGRILFPGGVTTPVTGSGYGRSLFPGATAPPVAAPVNSSVGMTFVGGPPAFPTTQPQQSYRNRGGVSAVAVPVPLYYYTGFNAFDPNWNWGFGQPNAQPVTAYPVVNDRANEPPVVIVNQYFTGEQNQNRATASAAATPDPAASAPQTSSVNQDREVIFMIAMKDHTIYAASAYWVEDGTLNYVTIQGDQNSVSMDLVDRELSQRLNRDRRIAFGLPSR